jgi:two-component system chemotaxis sensor kinase CheA
LSGRGVGLDVVKNNIERIGGSVNIQSEPGHSTTFRIKIPLTLAIIPALVITCDAHRYAIPQVNPVELVRIDGEQSSKQIEYVSGAPVYRLRGNLLPLVYLSEQLGVRERINRHEKSLFLLVLQAETRQFGLVVDAINDTEEIVVKPLGKELKHLAVYAGATIMGDGRVALILDVLGLARRAGIVGGPEADEHTRRSEVLETASGSTNRSSILLFSLGKGRQAAIALSHVARLEEFDLGCIESGCNSEVIQYRGEIMPVIRLADVLGLEKDADEASDRVRVIVYSHHGKRVGFVVHRVIDIVDDEIELQKTSSRPGIAGSAVIRKRVTEFIDTEAVIRHSGVVCFEKAIA